MRAAFALLADDQTHNAVRKLVWQMFQQHGISLATSRLPCHVSFKQPFEIADVAMLDDYMVELAESLFPVEITLTEMEIVEARGEKEAGGILWLHAEWSPELWDLHDRINKELKARFGSTQADFDGPEYQFHLTLSIGKPFAIYERTYLDFKESFTRIEFQAPSLALFVYDDNDKNKAETGYMSYKILPLGK